MILVLLGAPGAGKGVQGRMIAERLGLPRISTGDMLRAEAAEDSPLGRTVAATLAAGDLVDDDLMAEVVRSRTAHDDCRDGYLLDGYPRTLPQARTLDALASEQGKTVLTICIEVPVEELTRRLVGRRSCPECGEIYNVYTRPPRREGLCDHHDRDVALVHRSDDNERSVAHRLEVWATDTLPLCEFYRRDGRVLEVEGSGATADIFASICERLESLRASTPP